MSVSQNIFLQLPKGIIVKKIDYMEEDEFQDYAIMKKETDSKAILDLEESSHNNIDDIRRKLNNVMYSACFCSMCVEKDDHLTSVYTPLHIGSVGSMLVLDMLSEVFHDTADLLASSFICTQCLEKTIQSYKFIQNTKQSAKTIHEYIGSFETKVITLEEQIEENVDYSNTKFVLLIAPNEGITSVDVNTNREKEEESEFEESLNDHTNVSEDETEDIPVFDEPLGMLPDPIPDINLYIEDENKVKPIKTKNHAFKCSVCDVIMITFKEWKKHEHTYHKVDNNKPMPCEICFKVIANKRCLLEHYRRHNRDKCKRCNVIIPIVNLKSHMREEHAMKLEEKPKEITADKKNQCPLCFRAFRDEKKLKEHPCRFKCSECSEDICIHHKYLVSFRQQSLNKSTRFRCPDCSYIYLKRDLLIGHANKAHLNQCYDCEFCSARYFSKNGLKTHILRCHSTKIICEYCDCEFKDEDECRMHVQLCKIETRNVKCLLCLASFDTEEELTFHEDLRHKGHPCGVCNMTFTTEQKQREHMSKVHTRQQRVSKRDPNYHCPICEETFKLRGDRMRHLVTHGPEYTCNMCEEKFKNPTLFIRHHYYHVYRSTKKRERREKRENGTIEVEEESLVCDTCGKIMKSRARFLAHRRAHLEPVCCTICSKMVKAVSIYSHMRCHLQQNGLMEKRVYKSNRKYQCDQCDYVGTTRQTIETHINRVHLKVTPYVCGKCDAAYCNKYQLIEHENSKHNEEKWLTCQLCDKVLRCKRAMVKHMMRHNGEKPHVCHICSKGFIDVHQLNEHTKTHTEGKTTVCPLCDSMFYSIKHLRLHIKRVHWKRHPSKPFDPKLVRGLEGFQYIFQDKRRAVVEQ